MCVCDSEWRRLSRLSLYWVIDWLVVAEACRGAWAEIDGCLCRQLLLNWLQWPQLLLACDVAATAVIASFFSSSTVSWLFRIRSKCFFLPRDAIPARYMLSSRVRLSVRTSVTSRHCTETTRRTELIFCKLPLTYPELFVRKFGHLKNKGTSLWNFTPNAGLRKFRHGESMVWSTKLVDGRACGLCLRRSSASWLDAHSLLHVGRL